MSEMVTVDACRRIALPGNSDSRGKLAFAEAGRDVPFLIARLFYLYEVTQGASRGAHAHRQLHQGFIPIAGSFDIALDDGRSSKIEHLGSPRELLHVPPGIWVDVRGFSAGAVCLVLASAAYDESDYIRERPVFLSYRGVTR